MRFSYICETGLKRKTNQDNFGIIETANIFVVADGMGGHKGGETASKIAVEEIEHFFQAGDTMDIDQSDLDADPETLKLRNLKQAIRQANRAIFREARLRPEKRGMGTTVVILHLSEEKAYVAHVGDSRLYRLNNYNIRQVTKDHSRLQELIDANQVTPEEVENYPFKNIITRALGSGMDIEVDTSMFPYSEQDAFFLCTDGISAVLSDEDISSLICQESQDPIDALKNIAHQVDERGAPDNYSAILVMGDDFMKEEIKKQYQDTGPIDIPDDLVVGSEDDTNTIITLTNDAAIEEDQTEGNNSIDIQNKEKLNSNEREEEIENVTFSSLDDKGDNNLSHKKISEQSKALIDQSLLITEQPAIFQVSEKKEKKGSSTFNRYLVIILLLLGLFLTLCTINSYTFWVQYNGEKNIIDILKGKFHPFERQVIDTIEVVPNELWMLMIQDQEMKSELNRGKSFFRFHDLKRFIARLLLDIGLRYHDEGGDREQLIAIDLFRRGKKYGRVEQFNEYLVKSFYNLGIEYEKNGDQKNALKYYTEAMSLDAEFKDIQKRVESLKKKQLGLEENNLDTKSPHLKESNYQAL